MPNMPVPFGDDVSAINIGEGKLLVLKTDMLVGKTDVPPSMSLWQAARKAVVMTVSDFASKGAKPQVGLISLGLPKNTNEGDIEEIAEGLNEGAREYNTYLVGGDTNEASDLIIAVSLVGIADGPPLMLRNGAKAGDIVAVTGSFGQTTAGLRILLEDLEVTQDLRDVLVRSVFVPRAKLDEGIALRNSKAATASIDSSDGLAWSLHEIAEKSNVGFFIDKLPISDEVKRVAQLNRVDAVELALYGGEEYELVVTVNPKLWVKAVKAVEAAGGSLFPIGKATKNNRLELSVDYGKREIEKRGWEHFKSN